MTLKDKTKERLEALQELNETLGLLINWRKSGYYPEKISKKLEDSIFKITNKILEYSDYLLRIEIIDE